MGVNNQFYPVGWILRHGKTGQWYAGSTGPAVKRVRNWAVEVDQAKTYRRAAHAIAAATLLRDHLNFDRTVPHCLWFERGHLVAVRYDPSDQVLTQPYYHQAMSHGGWYDAPLSRLPDGSVVSVPPYPLPEWG